ncbi:hypothetical protein P167DRAFT_547644 [Morchella conica CCBAS932]|uniref:Uncharacterized protein n=1 Tax=Morchella conica CCBAS932 TaxID=1392247 RepID=A0A3N4KVS6_9PEZI|nr:hypothetical protein P167DRAFT_547644 [Morchella conica CCBAS932]
MLLPFNPPLSSSLSSSPFPPLVWCITSRLRGYSISHLRLLRLLATGRGRQRIRDWGPTHPDTQWPLPFCWQSSRSTFRIVGAYFMQASPGLWWTYRLCGTLGCGGMCASLAAHEGISVAPRRLLIPPSKASWLDLWRALHTAISLPPPRLGCGRPFTSPSHGLWVWAVVAVSHRHLMASWSRFWNSKAMLFGACRIGGLPRVCRVGRAYLPSNRVTRAQSRPLASIDV